MFRPIAKIVSRRWGWVIFAWLALAAALRAVAPNWEAVTLDGDLAYMPAEVDSVRGEKLLAEAFPSGKAKSQIVLVAARAGGPLTTADLAVLDRVAASLRQSSALPIVRVVTRHEPVQGGALVSSPRNPKGQACLLVVELSNEYMATDNIRVLAEVDRLLKQAAVVAPQGLDLGLTGAAAIGGDALGAAEESIRNIEYSTIALVVVILLAVYRAPLLALVPVLTLAVSTSVAMNLIALATQWEWLDLKIFKTTKIFVVVILFGGGTDYCLFLIARYKEELERGFRRTHAAAIALDKVSGALFGSAATTIVGLALMYFAQFGKFSYSGPVIAVCLTITLVACLTFSPALLRALGPSTFWPLGVRAMRSEGSRQRSQTLLAQFLDREYFARFWDWTAAQVVSHPRIILVTALVLLLPCAVAGWHVKISYDLLHDLEDHRPAVVGTRLLQRYFAPGEIGPLTVIARSPGWNWTTREGEYRVAELTRLLFKTPGVAKVRSLTEPLGERPYVNPLKIRKAAARKHREARRAYVSQTASFAGQVTRLDVVFDSDPFVPQSMATLDEIDRRLAELHEREQERWRDVEFLFAGTTAANRDLKMVTEGDERRIQVLVTLGVLAILLLLLRRPLVCAYLIFSVLFSYLVTIGATEVISFYWFGEAFAGLDWKVPLFLFVILVAVGEDYNIYLATRILEEQRRHGRRAGLRRAIVLTGGIITSCGVIMAGSFVSMMTGTLRGIVALGFALTLGILLDTFIIRTVLVPAFFALFASDTRVDKRPNQAPRTADHDMVRPPHENVSEAVGDATAP